MNYTKRRIKKYTHRKTYNKKTNINRKTNNRKIMRKTRRNNIMRVKVGGIPPIQSKRVKTSHSSTTNLNKFDDVRWSIAVYDASYNHTKSLEANRYEEIYEYLNRIKTNGIPLESGHFEYDKLSVQPFIVNELSNPKLLRETFYFNLLKYVVCNYVDVIRKFTAEFIRKLFTRLEEHSITGMFRLYEEEDACIIRVYKVLNIKPDLRVEGENDLVYSISNTIITKYIASVNPVCPFGKADECRRANPEHKAFYHPEKSRPSKKTTTF